MTATNFATGQIPTGITVDSATASLYTKDVTYPAGETLSAGNVVFIENAPTTAQATVYNQNIGDASSRTRVSFPIFGSGVLNQEMFKLNLMKIGSPSVSLGIRFETDDGSGNPSGTLLNATSSATVVAGDVTGAFVDTTILAAGFLAILAGKKCHCVVFQGTYGSETVNGSNYYRIGATNAIHTTTRGAKYWSGTAWGAMQNTVFPYIGSNPAQNPFSDYVLSKTDADYTYKIDWHGITQEAVTAGDLTTGKFPKIAISGIDSNQTGMTQGVTQYLSNTPGAISSSAGTNPKVIGEAISATKIQIERIKDVDCITFSKDTNTASTTTSYTHTLGRVPIMIRLTSTGSASSVGVYTKGVQTCVTVLGISAGYIAKIAPQYSDRYQTGVIQNITATSFDISWVITGTPTGIAYFICELS